jgi:hypothetical protein
MSNKKRNETKRCLSLLLKCPNCRSIDVGKIGVNQYYCWNCFIELTISQGVIHTHQVEEDGTLSSLDDLFSDDERTINL